MNKFGCFLFLPLFYEVYGWLHNTKPQLLCVTVFQVMASPCGCSIEDGPASSKYFLREVYSEQQIQQRVKELADQIALDYKLHSNVCYENELVLIVILKGGMFFLCDLARALAVRGVHHRVEVMSVGNLVSSSFLGVFFLIRASKSNIWR